MTYSRLEILESENPYEMFDDGEVLAEHRQILDRLSDEEKQELATKIIAECPKEKLAHYGLALKTLESPVHPEGTFHDVINQAHQIKTHILAMLDHPNPQLFLLEESSIDQLNKFHELALLTLKNNEAAIAERLAVLTPDPDHNKVARAVDLAFPDTSFAQKIKTTFALRREISQLSGSHPENFFTSPEFNRETCMTYSGLFELIKGNEEAIGKKLSQVSSLETRKQVERNLNLLTAIAYDQTNPFKLILDTLNPDSITAGRSTDSLFGSSSVGRIKRITSHNEIKHSPNVRGVG